MASRGRRGRRAEDDGWGNWGGYMNAKRQKLADQFAEEAPAQLKKDGSGSKIFRGITIYVNGYTKPSSDELKRMMMLHGGSYEHYLRRTRVSHVVATNLPDSKIRELKGLKVVRPEWITQSIAAGKLLPYTDYQMYTARSGRQQGLQGFTVGQEGNQSLSENQTGNQSRNLSGVENQTVNSESLDCYTNRTSRNVHVEKDDYSVDVDVDDDTENINPVFQESFEESDYELSDARDLERNETTSGLSAGLSKRHSESHVINKTATNETKTSPVTATKENHSPAKAGDPKFLNEYYTNSRLHYLSTWKAEFKECVNELQSKGDNFTGREKLRALVDERETTEVVSQERRTGKPKRCVMHVDMDCFFVSVGLRRRPDLKGKPVAVTHSKGKGATINPEADFNFEKKQWSARREQGGKKGKKKSPTKAAGDLSFPDLSDSDEDIVSDDVSDDVTSDVTVAKASESFHSMAEIASCSYEARKAGVRNGMFMGTAKRLCPDLVTIPYDFDGYKSVSQCLYETIASFTHDIEAVSCDEMLVDCTDLLADTGASPLMFAALLRREIFAKTGCPASAGIASSILLAKMATRKAKPDGQYHLTDAEVSDFIKGQSVRDIPGVGWSITKRFEKMGVITCGDLQKVTMDTLQREFGPKTGQSLFRYCRGQDDRPIKMEQQRKSVSAEVNYGIRFKTASESVKFIQELAEEVCTRLRNIGMKGKTVTLKLMVRRQDAPKETSKFMGHGICNNFSKSVTLPLATDNAAIVGKECMGILRQNRAVPEDLRGIGIQLQKLESAVVGLANTKSKGQSILNFAVSKSVLEKSTSEISEINAAQKVDLEKAKSPKDQSDNHIPFLDQSESVLQLDQVEGSPNEQEIESEPFPDLPEMLRDNGSRSPVNLVEEIAWRQVSPTKLPPLPCLPDLSQGHRTPRGAHRDTRTPKETNRDTASVTPSEDYFPSPSQVDPEVLNELPPEIRDQIQKELQSRRNQKRQDKAGAQPQTRRRSQGAGCSHWQEDRGENSTVTIATEEDQGSHDNDAIVALPSPSQIDPSCLSALPESLQQELKEAYARQNPAAKQGTSGMMNLQQAGSPTKSPSKSPGKRSPSSKRSPQFKVPRGRPSKRGRRKGTSKKLLFTDQSRRDKQVSSSAENISSHHLNDEIDIPVQQTSLDRQTVTGSSVSELRAGTLSGELEETLNQSGNVEETGSEVNLCGAVGIEGVRSLLKEWITSTAEPQPVDEEILTGYLQDLIIDKNLEQVDLVLKFMYRNIRIMDSPLWLHSLQNIYCHTQAAVKTIYGSKLASISL